MKTGIEDFAQILSKCCLENKVNLTSNERHTIYDAFKEYLSQLPAITDEDIERWMCEDTPAGPDAANVIYWKIFGAKAMRDGLIPASGNTVKEEEKESMKGFIESVKQITENTPELNMSNYDHDQVHILNEALLEIYALSHQFDHPISSAPDIKQGKEDTACDNCGHQNCNDCTVLSNE